MRLSVTYKQCILNDFFIVARDFKPEISAAKILLTCWFCDPWNKHPSPCLPQYSWCLQGCTPPPSWLLGPYLCYANFSIQTTSEMGQTGFERTWWEPGPRELSQHFCTVLNIQTETCSEMLLHSATPQIWRKHSISDWLHQQVHRWCDVLQDHHHRCKSETVDDCWSAITADNQRHCLKLWRQGSPLHSKGKVLWVASRET